MYVASYIVLYCTCKYNSKSIAVFYTYVVLHLCGKTSTCFNNIFNYGLICLVCYLSSTNCDSADDATIRQTSDQCCTEGGASWSDLRDGSCRQCSQGI